MKPTPYYHEISLAEFKENLEQHIEENPADMTLEWENVVDNAGEFLENWLEHLINEYRRAVYALKVVSGGQNQESRSNVVFSLQELVKHHQAQLVRGLMDQFHRSRSEAKKLASSPVLLLYSIESNGWRLTDYDPTF